MIDVVRRCEALVAIASPSVQANEPVCTRIAEWLEPLGARITVQRSERGPGQVNLLATLGPEGRAALALAGHADTVPFDASMRATDQPERDGRRLYGRGSCDMKGGIAAMVGAMDRVGGAALKRPVLFAFTFQEEIGCHGIKHMREQGGIDAERCIVGEPTGLRPVTEHKGYTVGRLRIRGVPCHSSDPSQGISAVHAAARAVDATLRLGHRWSQQSWATTLQPPHPTLNIGLFQGGTARNVVPEQAGYTIEIRPLPGLDGQALLDEAFRAGELAARTVDERLRFERVVDEVDPPLFTPPGEDLVQFLCERTGMEPGAVPFYTEAPTLREMGARTVVCGPGGIEQAHRVDEYVDFDALERAEQLYEDAIRTFCC